MIDLTSILTKDEAKKLYKEFHNAHSKYSTSVGGHWARNWKKLLPDMDLKNGYWYWKGHKVSDLHDVMKQRNAKKKKLQSKS